MSHLNVCMLPSPQWFRAKIMDTSLEGHLAYGSRSTIVLVDIRDTPVLRERFVAHEGKVISVSFCKSKSALLLASVSDDGSLKVWNLKNQPELLAREFMESKRNSVVEWKHGSTETVFFSCGRTLKIYNMQRHSSKVSKYTERGDINALTSCPSDASVLAIGHNGGGLILFDIESQAIIRRLHGHDADIISISFRVESSKMLSSSSNDGIVRFWTVTDDGEANSTALLCRTSRRSTSSRNTVWVTTLCHPTDPDFVVTTSNSFDLLQWNITEDKPTKVILKTDMGGHERLIMNIIPNNYDRNIIITNSLDRQLIFWDLSLKRSVFQISTVIGAIHSLRFSPIDNVKLALGCSDCCIRIWNTSSSGKDSMKIFSGAIKGKILVVSWYPDKEGTLAFASDEGRVGILDTMSNRYSFFATSHSNAVYSLCWGPCNVLSGASSENSDKNSLYLYSCGGGRIFIHCMSDISRNAVQFDTLVNNLTLKQEEKELRLEASWKKDYSLLAVGNDSGSIHIYDGRTFVLRSLINTPDKQIQCLSWHPEYVSLSASKCSMHYWLACGSSSSNVCVYDLSEVAEQTKEEILFITNPTRLLKGHCDKAISVAWSPHVEGRAVSASFDNTVQVWDVVSGQPVVNFQGHTGRVFTVEWSILDPDVIFSAGEDGLVLKWRISEQNAVLPKMKIDRKRRRRKAVATDDSTGKSIEAEKKVQEETGKDSDAQPVDTALITEDSKKQETSIPIQHNHVAEVGEATVTEEDKWRETPEESLDASKIIDKSKGKKKVFHRPKVHTYMKQCSLSLYQKRKVMQAGSMKIVDWYSQNNGKCPDADFPTEENIYFGLFADRGTFYKTLEAEAQFAKKGSSTVPPIFYDVWKGSVKEGILEALETDELTDLHVSLAPLVSHAFWLEICEKYAHLLVRKKNYSQAALYLLACNKVYEAIDMLKSKSCYRDAVALARTRLPDSDPVIADTLEAWADSLSKDNQWEVASNCYIAAKQPLKAASIAHKRHDAAGDQLAAHICKSFKYFDESKRYALSSIRYSLTSDQWDVGKEVVASYPEFSGFLPILALQKSIVSQLHGNNDNYGLQVKIFSDSVLEEKKVVWRCLRIEGKNYIQHILSTIFSTLQDPNSESFKTVFAELKEWVQDLQGHRLSLVIFSVTACVSLFFLSVLSSGQNEVTSDALKYLNSAFRISQTVVELNFFDIITQLFFPFDVVWSPEEKKIKLLAVTETDSQSPFDLLARSIADDISNSILFQTQKFSDNVDFTCVPECLSELCDIQKISGVSSVDVLLAFFTMNLFNKMKDQISQQGTLLHCDILDISKTCEEVMEIVVSSVESNVTFDSQNTNSTVPENVVVAENGKTSENYSSTHESNEIETHNELEAGTDVHNNNLCDDTLIEPKAKHGSLHVHCFEESDLFLRLSQVFSACVCKDAFAVKHYLKIKKLKAENSLFSVRIQDKNKETDVPNIKTDIEETSQEVSESENAAVQDENNVVTNGLASCECEEITSVDAAGEPAHDLEKQYKYLLDLEKELDIVTQENSLPDCIPLVSTMKQLCDNIERNLGCPYVKTIVSDFSEQLQAWLEKFAVL